MPSPLQLPVLGQLAPLLLPHARRITRMRAALATDFLTLMQQMLFGAQLLRCSIR